MSTTDPTPGAMRAAKPDEINELIERLRKQSDTRGDGYLEVDAAWALERLTARVQALEAQRETLVKAWLCAKDRCEAHSAEREMDGGRLPENANVRAAIVKSVMAYEVARTDLDALAKQDPELKRLMGGASNG